MKRRTFLRLATAAASTPLLSLSTKAKEAPPHKLAIIGHTGRGGFGHGLDTMWTSIPRVSVVAIADSGASSQSAALATERYPQARHFADYRQMLAEAKPAVVAIGPRHVDQHRDMILAAIESGARGVYIEKPFVRSLVEADEVVEACRRTGVRLAIAHRNRYHPALPLLRKMVADKQFGELLEMRARGKEDHRGGALDLWVLGSHLMNLATVFGGQPNACTGSVYQDGRPVVRADVMDGDEGIGALAGNEVHARFEMESGIPFFFESKKNAGNKGAGFGLQLICSEGIIDLRIDSEPLAHVLRGSPFRPTREPRTWEPVTTGGLGAPEPIQDIKRLVAGHGLPAEDLIDAIEQKREPLCGVEDARKTIEMISAVFESHRLSSQRVLFPLSTRVNPFTLL